MESSFKKKVNNFFRYNATVEVSFSEQRSRMIENQIIRRGIRNERVLNAMREVPRELFVPDEWKDRSYFDGPLPIGSDQTISQPFMVATMLTHLELSGAERVLEIGTGSGYQAAILSRLCAHVVTMERIPTLAMAARERLRKGGYHNVEVILGNGAGGYPAKSPFQGIILAAGLGRVPEPLLAQLDIGGRIVAPVGGPTLQHLTTITRKSRTVLDFREGVPCVFVPLIDDTGIEGWS